MRECAQPPMSKPSGNQQSVKALHSAEAVAGASREHAGQGDVQEQQRHNVRPRSQPCAEAVPVMSHAPQHYNARAPAGAAGPGWPVPASGASAGVLPVGAPKATVQGGAAGGPKGPEKTAAQQAAAVASSALLQLASAHRSRASPRPSAASAPTAPPLDGPSNGQSKMLPLAAILQRNSQQNWAAAQQQQAGALRPPSPGAALQRPARPISAHMRMRDQLPQATQVQMASCMPDASVCSCNRPCS